MKKEPSEPINTRGGAGQNNLSPLPNHTFISPEWVTMESAKRDSVTEAKRA